AACLTIYVKNFQNDSAEEYWYGRYGAKDIVPLATLSGTQTKKHPRQGVGFVIVVRTNGHDQWLLYVAPSRKAELRSGHTYSGTTKQASDKHPGAQLVSLNGKDRGTC